MGVKLRSRKNSKGKRVYYLDIHHGGIRSRKTIHIPHTLPEPERRKIAQLAANKHEIEILSGETGIQMGGKQRNFIRYFENYQIEFKPKNRKYINVLTHLKKCFGSTLMTTQINNATAEKWKHYLESNFRGETPSSMWSTWKVVVNRAIRDGLLPQKPFDITRPRIVNKVVKNVLYPGELQKMATTPLPDELVCRAFIFCCYTGLGRPEVARLTRANISEGVLTYERRKTKRRVTVPLHPSAQKQIYETHYLFPHMPSDSYCSRILKKWVKLAGIEKNISWYCARHTFAVMLLSNGADLKTVADLMGHSSVAVTEKYLSLVSKNVTSAAIHRIPGLDQASQ